MVGTYELCENGGSSLKENQFQGGGGAATQGDRICEKFQSLSYSVNKTRTHQGKKAYLHYIVTSVAGAPQKSREGQWLPGLHIPTPMYDDIRDYVCFRKSSLATPQRVRPAVASSAPPAAACLAELVPVAGGRLGRAYPPPLGAAANQAVNNPTLRCRLPDSAVDRQPDSSGDPPAAADGGRRAPPPLLLQPAVL